MAGRRGDVPGEVRAVEAVLRPVPVDLTGRVVERERVERASVERDLGAPVGPAHGAELLLQRRRCGEAVLARHGQRRPDRGAGTAGAQDLAALLLIAEVEGLAVGIDEDAATTRVADGH